MGKRLEPGHPKYQANLDLAAKNGQALDSWGRRKGGAYQEEELQTYHLEDGTTEQRWRLVCRDDIRCRALVRASTNPWRGNQCPRPCIKGAPVCGSHGGNLPNVKKSAARRLAMASDPAAEKLIHMALTDKSVSDEIRLKALIQILDRAGIAGKTTLELEIKPWQSVLQKIYGSMNGSEAADDSTLELEEGVDYEVLEEGQ